MTAMRSIADIASSEPELARATMRKVSARLLPVIVLLFLSNWVDRTNVAIAAIQMNRDLGFSASAYGFGVGIFFIGYSLFEIPSNLILARVGARRWIARIAITWGIIASAMIFVRTPAQFYAVRLLLGIAEAGFMPGVIYYLTLWFPSSDRARATARFMAAIPLAGAISNTLGGWLLHFDGRLGLHGWQWIFLVEGIPPVILGVLSLRLLSDSPERTQWLSIEQREWLANRLRLDAANSAALHDAAPLRGLRHPLVWLMAGMHLLMAMPIYAYAFWAPLFVRDALHSSAMTTGLIVGAFGGIAVVTTLLSGAHSDRTGDRALHASAGSALSALGCLGAAIVPVPLGRVAALALVEIGARSYAPAFVCLTPMLLRGPAAAAGIALVNTIFSIGGFVGPSLVGWFTDATGSPNGAFLILAGFAMISSLLCVLLSRYPVFARATAATGAMRADARARIY